MNLIRNRYFLLGILLLLLLAIPVTLFIIRRSQDLQSSAAPLTTLAVEPATVTASICDASVTMDVTVDPDKNLVSIVDMHIVYDASKLTLTEITPNQTAFPLTLRGPTIGTGTANISVSIGSDVTKAIQTKTKVATLKFKPVAATTGGPVKVSLDPTQTRVFSLSRTDEPGENVLLNALASNVTINQQTCGNVSVTPTTGPGTPTPTTPGGGTTTPAPTTPPLINQAPVCSGLTIDRQTSGTAPYAVAFTANGSDANGTISKVSFNFGDGPVQDVTTGGGIGTKSVSLQTSHTYNNPGTFNASVTLFDNDGAISSASASCSQTITVSAPPQNQGGGGGSGSGDGGGGTGDGNGGAAQPTPTLESPGSVLTTVGVIGGVVLTLIGGLALFIL